MPHFLFIAMLLLYVAACIYFVVRFNSVLNSRTAKIVVSSAIVLLTLSFFLQRAIGVHLPEWGNRLMYVASTNWLIILMYASVILLLLDLARCLARLRGTAKPLTLRTFGLVAIMIILLFTVGYRTATTPRIVHYKVQSCAMPEGQTMKIALVSDLHLGYAVGREDAVRMAEMINEQNADLCIIAGDMIDGDLQPVTSADAARPIDYINCPMGVVQVLGNHEYIGNVDADLEYINTLKVKMLVDSAMQIGPLNIIGRDDKTLEHFGGERRNLQEMLSDTLVNVVVDHQPADIQASIVLGVDLHLSGHTHGGQIVPVNLVTPLLFDLDYGHIKRGRTDVIVTSGYGTWGPRLRLGTQSEIVIIEISHAPKSQDLMSLQMVDTHGLKNFDCNRKHIDTLATADWDYVSGLVANAVLMAYQQYPSHTEYLAAVEAFADHNLSLAGDTIYKGMSMKKGQRQQALAPSNIDDLASARIFFGLYDAEIAKGDTLRAERYRTAATHVRNKLKTNHSRIEQGEGKGGFFHKAIYPNQMWLDGLYMGAPVYAAWQNHFGQSEGDEANSLAWSDIARQFQILHAMTYDPDKQLCYHAWSADPADANSFWANRSEPFKGCSKEFWGRSMGWYFAALVDVLEIMPKQHAEYQSLLTNFRTIAQGLARWQDKQSGLWYQLLQYDSSVKADSIGDVLEGQAYNVGNQANYLEASASSMYTYVYYKGVRLGLLPEKYLDLADKAYQGLLDYVIYYEGDSVNIGNICASAGLGPAKDPSRTGTINYYLSGNDTGITCNEGKGIGPFIMASLEKEKLGR